VHGYASVMPPARNALTPAAPATCGSGHEPPQTQTLVDR